MLFKTEFTNSLRKTANIAFLFPIVLLTLFQNRNVILNDTMNNSLQRCPYDTHFIYSINTRRLHVCDEVFILAYSFDISYHKKR